MIFTLQGYGKNKQQIWTHANSVENTKIEFEKEMRELRDKLSALLPFTLYIIGIIFYDS